MESESVVRTDDAGPGEEPCRAEDGVSSFSEHVRPATLPDHSARTADCLPLAGLQRVAVGLPANVGGHSTTCAGVDWHNESKSGGRTDDDGRSLPQKRRRGLAKGREEAKTCMRLRKQIAPGVAEQPFERLSSRHALQMRL